MKEVRVKIPPVQLVTVGEAVSYAAVILTVACAALIIWFACSSR